MIYFLSLYMTAIAHYWVHGGIWTTTVQNVPWFSAEGASPPEFQIQTLRTSRTSHDIENPIFKDEKHNDDEDFIPPTPYSLFGFSDLSTPTSRTKPPTLVHAQSTETLRPTWAKSVKMRRGVDQPFVLPGAKHLSRMIKACMLDTTPPAVPPKSQAKVYELPKLDLLDLTLEPRYPSYSQFPESVHDEDKPIKYQRLSQWVRADRASSRSA